MNKKHFLTLLIIIVFAISCQKTEQIEHTIENFIGFKKPTHFPEANYHFNTNTITKEGFELGRRLFYENKLSRNNTISCGSCHIQSAAFTHRGHSVSHGIDDRLGTRNAPPIMNLAWQKTFMWDGGIFDLDLQPIAPITNHVEMDENMPNIINKLKNVPEYTSLFTSAFGNQEITSTKIMKALSQFMLMCVSSNAKYDQVMRHEAGISFTADEYEGYLIFQKKCASCHAEPLFSDDSFRNNGLSITPLDDKGRYAVTLNPDDRYKFKVPSLRNLDFTAPYMHDGRFLTIDAVLNHYLNEVINTPNLDPILQKNNKLGIDISADEKIKLLAFLKTLNDYTFISNKLLSEQ